MTSRRSGRLVAVTVAASACVLAACASSDSVDSTPTPTSAGTEQVAPTATDEPERVTTSIAPTPTEPPTPNSVPATNVEIAETTAAPTPSDPSSPSDPPSTSCVDELSVREQAALLVWPAVYADDWPGAVAVVRDNGVGGVLLMSQQGLDAQTVSSRLAELEAASRHGLIVATDEEGGDVQRLRDLEPLPSQRTIRQMFAPDEAAALIAEHGLTVRGVGVDMVLGPVIDVEPNVGEVPLEPSRFFDGPPQTVSDYGAAYLSGWARADLFATVKHYPGHGAASGDTHITDGVTPSLGDLESFDLKPYRDLAGLVETTQAAVMIGHLTVPDLTDGVPATRSAAAVSYLRDDLGYGDTLLITDALGMAAVGLPEPEASVLALQAGIDVVLFTLASQTDEVIDAIEAAVEGGTVSRQHVTRAAAKVMVLLARDGHTCNTNR